jgi:ubiquitin-like 1-activating enzyme E1 A
MIQRSLSISGIAIWHYQSLHNGELPNDAACAAELESIAHSLLAEADVSKKVITAVPRELLE